MMSVPLVLDDSEPAKALMMLMESKKYKQGLDKNKRARPLPPHESALEISDLDGTPHPHTHSQPHPRQVEGQVPHAAACRVDRDDEEHPPVVNRPTQTDWSHVSNNPIRVPDVTANCWEPSQLQYHQNPPQHNKRRYNNVSVPSQQRQPLCNDHDDRYMFQQASQQEHSTTDSDEIHSRSHADSHVQHVHDRIHDNWYAVDVPPRHAPADMRTHYPPSSPLPHPPQQHRNDVGHHYRQPLLDSGHHTTESLVPRTSHHHNNAS